jgi:hypothetical protein
LIKEVVLEPENQLVVRIMAFDCCSPLAHVVDRIE